jgi:hypothetical protein
MRRGRLPGNKLPGKSPNPCGITESRWQGK